MSRSQTGEEGLPAVEGFMAAMRCCLAPSIPAAVQNATAGVNGQTGGAEVLRDPAVFGLTPPSSEGRSPAGATGAALQIPCHGTAAAVGAFPGLSEKAPPVPGRGFFPEEGTSPEAAPSSASFGKTLPKALEPIAAGTVPSPFGDESDTSIRPEQARDMHASRHDADIKGGESPAPAVHEPDTHATQVSGPLLAASGTGLSELHALGDKNMLPPMERIDPAPPAASGPGGFESHDPVSTLSLEEALPEESLADMVKKAVWSRTNGAAQVKIQLKPDWLGQLHLHVRTEDHRVSLHIKTETATVRDLIESHLPGLRSELQNSGLDVAKMNVVIDQDLDGRGHSQPNPGQKKFALKHTDADPVNAGGNEHPAVINSMPFRPGTANSVDCFA